MNTVFALEHRLDQVAEVVKGSPEGLAVLGLGSAGIERERLDQWSDLDFFVLVRPGTKGAWLDDPSWLEAVHPVAYRFRNTADGFKLLWDDGVFAEMAVFEPAELERIPYAEGRLVWAHPDFDPTLRVPRNTGAPTWKPESVDWSLGELLTCLYVGLCRYRRGEKLSAWRFVQGHCLDRFLEVVEATETPEEGLRDPYSADRRFEVRFPGAAAWLSRLETGYDRTPEAALAFLGWTETRTEVNRALAAEIRRLASG